MARSPRTPCIGICSTSIGDDVCRGCKRFAQEVIDWNGYNNEERRAVLDRLDQLLVQTVRAKFDLVDQERLRQRIRFQQILCNFDKDPHCWIFDLLRQGASQIEDIEEFGIRLKPEWKHLPLPELKNRIDREHYELSCAYYERYIVPGQRATIVS